jgi:hypothetical protein
MLLLNDPELSTSLFTSACTGIAVQTHGTAFVDDSSISVTSTYHRDLKLTLAQNNDIDNDTATKFLIAVAQHWEKLLFSTGGAINMQKSFWYLMAWVWNGVPSLVTMITSRSNTAPIQVPCLDVTDSF